jgi:hypothetical protein
MKVEVGVVFFPLSTAESEREKYYVGILEVIEQGSDRAGAVAS